MKNPNFVIDADGSGMAGLRDGTINALFSGPWVYDSVREILGDDIGAAALPTYQLNGEGKQMYAYSGSKAVGVNAASNYMVPAIDDWYACFVAGAVPISIPIAILFLNLQNYYVNGMTGAVKE